MLGACYLTERTEGLEHLYDLGAEVECYRTVEELVSKLGTLTLDRPRRMAMRERAQRRALMEHSVMRTAERIGNFFNLPAKSCA